MDRRAARSRAGAASRARSRASRGGRGNADAAQRRRLRDRPLLRLVAPQREIAPVRDRSCATSIRFRPRSRNDPHGPVLATLRLRRPHWQPALPPAAGSPRSCRSVPRTASSSPLPQPPSGSRATTTFATPQTRAPPPRHAIGNQPAGRSRRRARATPSRAGRPPRSRRTSLSISWNSSSHRAPRRCEGDASAGCGAAGRKGTSVPIPALVGRHRLRSPVMLLKRLNRIPHPRDHHRTPRVPTHALACPFQQLSLRCIHSWPRFPRRSQAPRPACATRAIASAPCSTVARLRGAVRRSGYFEPGWRRLHFHPPRYCPTALAARTCRAPGAANVVPAMRRGARGMLAAAGLSSPCRFCRGGARRHALRRTSAPGERSGSSPVRNSAHAVLVVSRKPRPSPRGLLDDFAGSCKPGSCFAAPRRAREARSSPFPAAADIRVLGVEHRSSRCSRRAGWSCCSSNRSARVSRPLQRAGAADNAAKACKTYARACRLHARGTLIPPRCARGRAPLVRHLRPFRRCRLRATGARPLPPGHREAVVSSSADPEHFGRPCAANVPAFGHGASITRDSPLERRPTRWSAPSGAISAESSRREFGR